MRSAGADYSPPRGPDGTRLFALVLAPVFAEARLRPRQGALENRVWDRMVDALTAAAMAALTQTGAPRAEVPTTHVSRPREVGDLFDASQVALPPSEKEGARKAQAQTLSSPTGDKAQQ